MLGALPVTEDPRVLVGFENAEDAAVFRLDDDRAAVVTIDVITPLVDDPFLFGEIAAANALSDVYAMGGDGILSLSFLSIPEGFPGDLATEIARGGATMAGASGAPVVGGHSIQSKDLLFGLAVVGLVEPAKMFRNDLLVPDDQLILTKPLGTGALTTALKQDALGPEDIEAATSGMRQTNRAAIAPCREHRVRAATDITGFGLLGHAAEMAKAAAVKIVIDSAEVPAYPMAEEMLAKGARTRGDKQNPEYARSLGPVTGTAGALLADPQTSGGLLVGASRDRCDGLLAALRLAGYASAARIGEVRKGAGIDLH